MKIDQYSITIGNATDVGKIREHNEDYMAHFNSSVGYCIIVCDGMGGHAAGEVASQQAVEAIRHFMQDGKITRIDTPSFLINAIEFANFKLRELIKSQPSLKGMGTTCILALISNGKLHVAHAGDSRIYLLRGKGIRQISKDHSTVQNMVDAGLLTEEEARFSDRRNEITKAIGIFERVDPTVTEHPFHLAKNDRLVLCSDGLTTHVDDDTIREIVGGNPDVQEAAMQLVAKANEDGGSDNITVQVIHFTGKSAHSSKPRRKRRKLALTLIILVLLLGSAAYYRRDILFGVHPAVPRAGINLRTREIPAASFDWTDSIKVSSEPCRYFQPSGLQPGGTAGTIRQDGAKPAPKEKKQPTAGKKKHKKRP